jgi:hypothetical protein
LNSIKQEPKEGQQKYAHPKVSISMKGLAFDLHLAHVKKQPPRTAGTEQINTNQKRYPKTVFH